MCCTSIYNSSLYDASMAPKMCIWRRLGIRHKRLGVVKGVERHASLQRLKNIALTMYSHGP
jgi:hypothetical protein